MPFAWAFGPDTDSESSAWAGGTDPGSGIDTTNILFGFQTSNSGSCDGLFSPAYGITPTWTSDSWGPIPIVIVIEGVYTPNTPAGNQLDISRARLYLNSLFGVDNARIALPLPNGQSRVDYDFSGRWVGPVSGDVSAYSVDVTIQDDGQDMHANVSYPELGCTGHWTQTSRAGDTAVLHEVIDVGARCLPEVEITLTKSEDGTLGFSIDDPSDRTPTAVLSPER